MKKIQNVLTVLAITLLFASCAKENLDTTAALSDSQNQTFLNEAELLNAWGEDEGIADRNLRSLTVYTLSNEESGNEVIAFRIQADGTLNEMGRYSTGGTGTDSGLGNQGALTVSDNSRFLYVVNPGSNDFSVFYIRTDGGLVLKETMDSGGERPVSITVHDGIIYVLNAGGNGNIAGFGFNSQAKLMQIWNSVRPLSTNATGPAQISFSPNGKALVVTEKMTNTITSYGVVANRPGSIKTFSSAGTTPFGFVFGRNNNFYVTEAAGGAPGASTVSSYHVDNSGNVNLVDGPVATNNSSACWAVLTKSANYLYTTNTASNNISTISVSGLGNLTTVAPTATPAMSTPIDAALDRDSKYLYVLTTGNNAIISYSIGTNGALTQIDMDSNNLPDNMTGLVVK